MKSSVIVFPGSNCDRDIAIALKKFKIENQMVWHAESSLPKTDLVVLPGGFSYGDYLRTGCIASKSRIINDVIKHAKNGGLVLGICNGFQILTEAGFLPGTLLMNKNLKFICKCVDLLLTNKNCKFTNSFNTSRIILPIAHKVGNYYINQHGLNSLIENDQIIFRYSSSKGQCNDANNPNGSIYNIAGIINKRGNVLGMMPHPERFYNNIDKDLIMKRIIESISNAR